MAGQIIKRGENTWTVRIFLGRDTSGSRKYFNKTIRGTKRDAQTYLTAKLREKDLGIFVEPASMAMDKYLDGWLQDTAKPRLRERTLDSYESVLKLYIRPRLGTKRLCDLGGIEIQKVYSEMQSSGLSARTVRYAHTILSSALKQAVKLGMLNQNPCDQCQLPRQERQEMKCFTPNETARFLEAAKETKWYSLFLLAIETGMRPEEYLGLQWKDIDFENNAMSVCRAVVARSSRGFHSQSRKPKRVADS